MSVEDVARLVPFGTDDTAAFVRIRNDGDGADALHLVEARRQRAPCCAATVTTDRGRGQDCRMISSVDVPANGTVGRCLPHDTDIMISAPPRLRAASAFRSPSWSSEGRREQSRVGGCCTLGRMRGEAWER
ncbi:hypothetical protein GCM10020221_25040 [Streptomyces thioluteus]|uniref:Uncharacterized protein n=1 Tax=Streptomyces thioluteus TaxID=66431 RepID=A0ABN3WVL4_STRTU